MYPFPSTKDTTPLHFFLVPPWPSSLSPLDFLQPPFIAIRLLFRALSVSLSLYLRSTGLTSIFVLPAMEMEGEGKGGEAVPVGAVVGEQYCNEEERELTVRKTSLFFPGDGFAAYDHQTRELVFRVDTYGRGPALADQLVLMDPTGVSILTLRRKWPSLHQRWEGFLGERSERQEPLFTVRRSSIFGGDRGEVAVEVHAYGGGGTYRIEGSFAQRCCRVLHEGRGGGGEGGGVVAEIKRKVDACAHVVLGRDVFRLCLRPRFDAAFAMGLVLVLDQICPDNEEDDISSADLADIHGDDSHADGDAQHS